MVIRMTEILDWTKDVSLLRKGITEEVTKKAGNGLQWKETNLKEGVLPFKKHKDVYKDMASGLINYSIRNEHFTWLNNDRHFNCDDACKRGAKLARDLGLIFEK